MKRLVVIIAGLIVSTAVVAQTPRPFKVEKFADMQAPLGVTFTPDGRMLVVEKAGRLFVISKDGKKSDPITEGLPTPDTSGQGGMSDVVVHPDFASNNMVYISFTEAGDNDTRGGAVGRGTLKLSGNGGSVENYTVIWRQDPKVDGAGHFSQRMHFSPDGKYLFITSGERQQGAPAQDLKVNLGKIIRLNPDGSIPEDNPFYDQGGRTAQIWSYGHRNLTGIDFDADGVLWETEMGPMGGDELNKIDEPGKNHGWPVVSNGNDYNGDVIPDHDTHPEFKKPVVWWNPSISPGGLLAYTGDMFPEWKGSFFLAGLSSMAIVRVSTRFGAVLSETGRWDMGARIRDLEQGPDGAIYALMDAGFGPNASGVGILKLTPADK